MSDTIEVKEYQEKILECLSILRITRQRLNDAGLPTNLITTIIEDTEAFIARSN